MHLDGVRNALRAPRDASGRPGAAARRTAARRPLRLAPLRAGGLVGAGRRAGDEVAAGAAARPRAQPLRRRARGGRGAARTASSSSSRRAPPSATTACCSGSAPSWTIWGDNEREGLMATDSIPGSTQTRESVPFTVRTADGVTVELAYSSPRPADDARRARRARDAAVVRARQAAPQLHAPRDRLLRRGRADLGPPLGRGRDRDAARGARLAPDRERGAAGVRAGVAVLLLARRRQRRPRTAAGAVRRVLPGARRQRRARELHRAAGARDRRLRLHQEPRHARRRRARRPRRRVCSTATASGRGNAAAR